MASLDVWSEQSGRRIRPGNTRRDRRHPYRRRHAITDYEGLDVSAPGYQDPHELTHANDIRRRFANR